MQNNDFLIIHVLHSQVAGISQEIDASLVKKIDELVKEGVSNVNEMRRHLRVFVKSTLFSGKNLPEPSNRRYFPRPKTIRNHIVHSKQKLRYSMIEQECLEEKVKQWKKEDSSVKIFFRPKSKPEAVDVPPEDGDEVNDEDGDSDDWSDVKVVDNNSSDNSHLFVYQTEWQRRLLRRYGNELALLDATYRTTRYALPLFFLVVKTNVDYQVVATFVCEGESTENIAEAMRIIREWNPHFMPRYFMTDYSNEEMKATEQVLTPCKKDKRKTYPFLLQKLTANLHR